MTNQPDTTDRVLQEVLAERVRQDDKWGQQNHPDGTAISGDDERAASAKHVCQAMAERGLVTWRDVLHEEVQEAFAETDPSRLRAELLQVAAVAVAWIEAIDRRTTADDTAQPVAGTDAPVVDDGRPTSPIIATHTLESDPPHALSSVARWTCVRCGCAVLVKGSHVYGSASSEECGAV